MFQKLMGTSNDWYLLVLRLAAGIMIFPHGMQKTFGWFGGAGFSAQMTGFANGLHIPYFFGFLAILAESLGAIGLAAGFLTRIAAFGVFCNMLVGAWLINLPNGFFMNWNGRQKGEGIEFHLLAVAILIVLMGKGAGALSIDRALSSKSGSAGADRG